jgi:signal transduction histidine kinase
MAKTELEPPSEANRLEKDSRMSDVPKQTVAAGPGGESKENGKPLGTTAQGDPRSELVYRRIKGRPERRFVPKAISARAREIAPTITPLIIGFTLLLGLISVLGYLSVRRMDQLSFTVADLERTHAAHLRLLLELRLAVTKLDNEARTRGEAEARRELKPPFDFRLSEARAEVNRLLHELERPPLLDDPSWRVLRNDLESYVELTQDARRYSLYGFSKFNAVNDELAGLLTASGQEQEQIIQQSEVLEREAARSIRIWSLIALLVGAVVAVGTMWEVQRRFRQMRISMSEARRERAFTNQLLEGMVSAVAAIDGSDRIRSANAAFFQIFPGASIGASLYEKFAPDDAMKMLAAATASPVDKATYRGRWVYRAGDNGVEKTLDVYSSPLSIDGEYGQILMLVDATEAAEAERGLRRTESLAAVGRATTQVAHEIRNPLGSIRLGVSMLRDNIVDPEALQTIELVERGIKHLNKLVVDVTQFSRQKALERTDVELHELIDRSLDLVSDRISEKHTPVEKSFSRQRLVGRWDADQLRQVFVNLIANAIDASAERSAITITTLTNNPDGDDGTAITYAQVVIADQGKGIDEPDLERIFEPFFSTKKRGTGLGLAIVKQIVEQHGGAINVQSEPGKGTRFIIDLPL